MGNGLVPERRVNKLGHVVTRHVRPASSGVPSGRAIPRVSAVSAGGVRAQWAADAEEFAGIKSLAKTRSFTEVREGILSGVVRLADIKAVGASRLAYHNRLGGFSEVLERHARGECARSIDEMKRFLDKAKRDHVVEGNFMYVLPLFEAKPMDEIEKLGNLQSFVRAHLGKFKNDPRDVDRAFGYALLSEALDRAGWKASGRFWADVFPHEAAALWEAGVDAEKAAPLMAQGLSAQQVIAVVNEEVESSLSNGWL